MALAILLISFKEHSRVPQNDGKFTVVLDAGHGGHDPGNLGNGYLEKNIALNIVLKAGAILEQHPDIKVIYTRKDDTFVD
ncbi:MAG: N-acetylmuramoyl-L-alanine amidase, partial [Pricia sp.]|nr:N-acetylmuramoyl-L-alanine amidase [Pricia sp.]